MTILTWARQFACGLTGHDAEMLRFEPGRLSLQCASCGRQTPGWSLGKDELPTARPAAGAPRSLRPLGLRRAS